MSLYKHVFIVTYGRSGSTLLQGVLNALPGYLIRGENYDTLSHFEHLFNKLPRFKPSPEPAQSTPKNPFFGFEAFNESRITTNIRLMFEDFLLYDRNRNDVQCLGFKEIRYSISDIDRKVAFLRTIFPNCAIVYNTRNPKDVVASEFQQGKDIKYFEQINSMMQSRAQADSNAFLTRYEDVSNGLVRELFDFLGESYDESLVKSVISVRHSYRPLTSGQFYSIFPQSIKVKKQIDDLLLLVADRYEVIKIDENNYIKIGGFMVPPENLCRRFVRVENGSDEVFFHATYDLPSLGLSKYFRGEYAKNSRFEILLPNITGNYRLFLDGDEEPVLSVTVD